MVRKLQNFQVEILNNKQVFYSGEQVDGAVIVEVTEPMKCNKITVKMIGLSYCHWTTTRTVRDSKGNSRTHTDHHTGSQELVNLQAILFGGSSTGAVRHPVGRYVYQFKFHLPAALPSSFEGGIGYIRYYIEGKVDRPWKFDHKMRKPFTVNEVIDINQPQYSAIPSGTKLKQIGCLCCVAGNVSMQVSLDRSGYCPGEQMFLSASCENESTRALDGMKATLIQNVLFRASDATRSKSRAIARFEGRMIAERGQDFWNNQPFLIPPVPPTIETIPVSVSYQVKFEVTVPMGFNPKILLGITMGTVPFRQSFGRQASYGLSQNQFMEMEFANWVPPSAPELPYAPPPAALGYPDMPPPSYAAAVGSSYTDVGDKEARSTFGDQSYMPVYTYAQPSQVPPMNDESGKLPSAPPFAGASSSAYSEAGPSYSQAGPHS